MPRPPKYRNPLSRWLENRKNRQKQLDQSADNVPAMEAALASADAIYAKLQKLIKDQSGESAADHNQ